MTTRILLGGRRVGRTAAAQAVMESERTIILTGQVAGLEVGKTVMLGGETYRIVGPGPGANQRVTDRAVLQQPVFEQTSKATQFGGDRPYLNRKKGRS